MIHCYKGFNDSLDLRKIYKRIKDLSDRAE